MNPESEAATAGQVILETIKTIIIVSFFALVIRTFLLQPFIVEGRSMEPNYHSSDYLLIDKLSYQFRAPKRGEVVVFRYPKDTRQNYIKRVIGLPGETVTISDNQIKVFNTQNTEGKPLHEEYLADNTVTTLFGSDKSLSITLQPDEYFVLGDNRDASSDSRIFGAVKENLILGKSLVRLFPLDSVRVFAHEPDPLF